MKLYTEEQVKAMIEKSQYTGLTADFLILTAPSVQLPSDEEIYKRAFQQWGDYSKTSHQNAYIEGAKWMRSKIKGGNI